MISVYLLLDLVRRCPLFQMLKTKKIADKIVFGFCVVPAMKRRPIMDETTKKHRGNRRFCLAASR